MNTHTRGAIILLAGTMGYGSMAHAQTGQPTYTGAQAQRGEAAYQDRCSGCHGDQLDNGQFAPPLVGPLFIQHWGGKGLDEPYTFMVAQMPPDNPGGLGPASYADIMAFIMSKNGVAASTRELPSDPDALKLMAVPK